MNSINKKNVLTYSEEICDEIFNVDVLINATKCCCQEKEYRGEYYGIPIDYISCISNERNEYLSLLTMLSGKIKHINMLHRRMEKELVLD